MAERTTVSQVVQLGVETTPGTSVAANRRLPGLKLDFSLEAGFTEVDASGYKFPTAHAPGKEWSSAKLSGQPSYDEVIYPLMSVLSYAAPVQQGATTAYKWSQLISSTAEDVIKTFTVENGSALRAHKSTYGIVSEFGLKGDRDKVEQTGMMLMQNITDGITLTAGPTEITQVPILPKEIDIFVDTTSGGLGTTKLTRVFKWEWMLKNRYGPVWPVNSALASWTAHVEQEIDANVKLLIEADAAGMALWASLKAGTVQFLRIQATSAVLAGTAFPYTANFDFAVEMKEGSKQFQDSNGVYALELNLGAIHDVTWAKAMDASVTNKRTVF